MFFIENRSHSSINVGGNSNTSVISIHILFGVNRFHILVLGNNVREKWRKYRNNVRNNDEYQITFLIIFVHISTQLGYDEMS